MKLPRARGGIELKVRISKYKSLYTEWINNKVILYNTENYTQYLVINHNGKDMKNNVYVYVCITE